ncbi:hypothetical protein Tco_0847428 [Tanacetum coccineum]
MIAISVSELNSKDYNKTIEVIVHHKVYRISGFSCEETNPWEKTLNNDTSLIFEKFIHTQEVSNLGFPEHYFDFGAYNELAPRANSKTAVLTACKVYNRSHHLQNQYTKALVLSEMHSLWTESETRSLPYVQKPWAPNKSTLQAIVSDGSATVSITCFSDQANSFTKDYNDVLAKLTNKDPYQLPPSLQELEGTTHIFQVHFDTGSSAKRPDFVLDTVFKPTALFLPVPTPIQPPPSEVYFEQPIYTVINKDDPIQKIPTQPITSTSTIATSKQVPAHVDMAGRKTPGSIMQMECNSEVDVVCMR